MLFNVRAFSLYIGEYRDVPFTIFLL